MPTSGPLRNEQSVPSKTQVTGWSTINKRSISLELLKGFWIEQILDASMPKRMLLIFPQKQRTDNYRLNNVDRSIHSQCLKAVVRQLANNLGITGTNLRPDCCLILAAAQKRSGHSEMAEIEPSVTSLTGHLIVGSVSKGDQWTRPVHVFNRNHDAISRRNGVLELSRLQRTELP